MYSAYLIFDPLSFTKSITSGRGYYNTDKQFDLATIQLDYSPDKDHVNSPTHR